MSVTGIRARFPLGVYVGHRPDQSPDVLPSTLRLHAALVAAASAGSSAEPQGATMTRSTAATRALQWVEDNPPDFVELPPSRENGQINECSFRDEGVVEKAGKGPKRRKTKRAVGTGTAVSAPIGWGWSSVPEDISHALIVLCEDVSCLGEADSPVILEFGEIKPTHRRSAHASPFARTGIRIATPIGGRLGELDELHHAAQPAKPPSIANDQWKKTESPIPSPITHIHSVDIRYDPIDIPAPPPAPWRHVIHISIDVPISNSERVEWSVALHRAMVAALDTETSAVITGRYDLEAPPPANRVAIQPVDDAVMSLSRHPHLGAGLAVLVPDGAMDVTSRALANVARLYRHGKTPIRLGRRTTVDAAMFWSSVGPGMVRTWESLPAVMPETRRPRRPQRRSWTLGDSALLSVGFVFRDALRDDFPPLTSGSAEERYASIVDIVESREVTILETTQIGRAHV